MTEEQKTDEKKFKLKLPKLSKSDKIGLLILAVFIILAAIPVYIPKGDCEIARPGYKCASSADVMIENCDYWGKYDCDTTKDVSLPQIEWYIGNLCKLASQKKTLDCANLKLACNQVTGNATCPVLG